MGKQSAWANYVYAVGAVDRAVNAALGAWGSIVAARPVLTIIVSSIVALALSGGLGLTGQNIESDGDKLWCAIQTLDTLFRTGQCAPVHLHR